MYVGRQRRAGGLCLFFLFDDLPQKLKGVFAQRRSHGNELDNIEPAFPAFILRNVRLRHPYLHAPRQPGTLGMAQAHITRTWRYRLFELVVLTKEQTFRETKWKLFDLLPVWRVKEALTKIL